MDLISRIKYHNAWRRGEHDNITDPTQLGKDLDLITEQNKMLQDALQMVSDMIPMGQNAYGGGYNLILSNDDCRIIKETLNICDLINKENKTC